MSIAKLQIYRDDTKAESELHRLGMLTYDRTKFLYEHIVHPIYAVALEEIIQELSDGKFGVVDSFQTAPIVAECRFNTCRTKNLTIFSTNK